MAGASWRVSVLNLCRQARPCKHIVQKEHYEMQASSLTLLLNILRGLTSCSRKSCPAVCRSALSRASPTSSLFSAPLWCPQLTIPFADTGPLHLAFPLPVDTVSHRFPRSLHTLQLRALLPLKYFLTVPSKLVNVHALVPVPSLYFVCYRHHF